MAENKGVTSGIKACMMAGEKLKERVSQLEEILREWSDDGGIVSMWATSVMNKLQV